MFGALRVIVTIAILVAAVGLYFTGYLTQTPEAIITWTTESEVNTAGFHVYRSTSANGPWEQVTQSLIQSTAPDDFTGGTYEFRDPNVEAETTYYYQLEELETTGTFTRLPDTVTYEAKQQPNYPYVVGLFAIILLVWLIPTPSQGKKAITSSEVV